VSTAEGTFPGTVPGRLDITVVIPVKDDAVLLARCLEALALQTRRPFEVVVVDNASTDDSAAVARAAGARVVVEPTVGIPAAASRGYDAVQGGIIARCDADTLPPTDWLDRVHRSFVADRELSAVTGAGTFYDLPRLRGRAARVFYMRGYFWGMRAALGNVPLWGSNMAIRVTTWHEVRHLVHRDDPSVHDDTDLSFQLGARARVRYDPLLTVGVSGRTFASPSSLGRRFRWARRTLEVNWAVRPPWDRWADRLTAPRGDAPRQLAGVPVPLQLPASPPSHPVRAQESRDVDGVDQIVDRS
jgi:glycosyltransferase involved in cell wall biosynthesis